MLDPKDPFVLTRTRVFGYGFALCALLTALIWVYVPKAPENKAELLPLQGPGSQSASLAEPSTPKLTELSGQQGYTRYCVQCHGAKGVADTQIAKMMEGKIPNLVSDTPKVARNVADISALIIKGSANGAMPGFEKELGPAGANRVAEYVLQLIKEQSAVVP